MMSASKREIWLTTSASFRSVISSRAYQTTNGCVSGHGSADATGLHRFYGSLARPATPRKPGQKQRSFPSGVLPHVTRLVPCAARNPIGSGRTCPTSRSVVKADPNRWGLRHWIDDEYDGIVGEILQRIEEDGGVTTTERLLTEIPAKFNVSPQSVRAYMNSARFEIRNGSIRLANPASIRLRDLDDVIDGRDRDGAPYWTFVVDDRYFQGYSVVGVPPEFAKAVGCEPDSGVDIEIQNLPDCRATLFELAPLQPDWRFLSATWPSHCDCSACSPETTPESRLPQVEQWYSAATSKARRTTASPEADATLERILRRRRAI